MGHRDDGRKTLNLPPRELAALEIEAIKTLKTQNDALVAKNKALEDRVANLETGAHPIAASFTSGLGISRAT